MMSARLAAPSSLINSISGQCAMFSFALMALSVSVVAAASTQNPLAEKTLSLENCAAGAVDSGNSNRLTQLAHERFSAGELNSAVCGVARQLFAQAALAATKRAVKAALLDRVHISAADISAHLASEDIPLEIPRKFRLRDITIHASDEAQRTQARKTLQTLKDRLVVDPSIFAGLAARWSDSATSVRGGKMGYVAIDRIVDPLATQLQQASCNGDLIGPLDIPTGVVLLRCEARIEPSIRSQHKREKTARSQLTRARLVQEMDDLGITADTDDSDLLERVATDLGIHDQLAAQWPQFRYEALAEAWLKSEVASRFVPPPESVIDGLFKQFEDRINHPATFDFELVEFDLTAHAPATLLGLGTALQAGETDLVAVARQLDNAKIQTFRRTPADRVFQMGKDVEHALVNLGPGTHSRILQEGKRGFFMKLLSRTESRPKTREEADQPLRLHYRQKELLRIRRALEAELLGVNPRDSKLQDTSQSN